MCKSDWQNLGVFACTPSLPVASAEGRVRDLGLRHLDWHNSTALANSALHIMGNIQIWPWPPRISQSGHFLICFKETHFPEFPGRFYNNLIRVISRPIGYWYKIVCSPTRPQQYLAKSASQPWRELHPPVSKRFHRILYNCSSCLFIILSRLYTDIDDNI